MTLLFGVVSEIFFVALLKYQVVPQLSLFILRQLSNVFFFSGKLDYVSFIVRIIPHKVNISYKTNFFLMIFSQKYMLFNTNANASTKEYPTRWNFSKR